MDELMLIQRFTGSVFLSAYIIYSLSPIAMFLVFQKRILRLNHTITLIFVETCFSVSLTIYCKVSCVQKKHLENEAFV